MSQEITRGERTRNEIIQAACRVFLQHGFHGSSMRAIAQEAGLAVGGIYNHFSGKEEVFLAVVMKYHPLNSLLPALKTAQGESVEGFVKDAATRLVQEFEQHQEFINLVFIEMVEFKGRHLPRLFETFFPQVVGFAQHFMEGRAELRPIPVPILVRAFIGLFFSYVVTDLLIGKQPLAGAETAAFESFVDIYLHGILEDPVP
jgi:AcrR family transcriptional regulator